MFGDEAPIWRFKQHLGAIEDPERARTFDAGVFLMEVFPALVIPSFADAFCTRLGAPRYNPARRKTFKPSHWQNLTNALSDVAVRLSLDDVANWCRACSEIDMPRKADQDRLDAVICTLIGFIWLEMPREHSAMIGDLQTGYMVTPVSPGVLERLAAAAHLRGVAVNGQRESPAGAFLRS